MAVEGLKQYLQRWRQGGRVSGATPTTSLVDTELPRSFRPHRIVPRVYLGALKDVEDTWELHQRLLPEEMLLIVSTCACSFMPQLEMRQILPVRKKCREKGVSPRVRRLAVCSWEQLEERISNPLGGVTSPTAAEEVMMATAQWLSQSLESGSFVCGGKTMEARVYRERKESDDVGLVYLKLCLPWRDEPPFPVWEHFHVSTAIMRAVVDGLGKAVVCHCIAGVSRSVTLVCAFLLRCFCDDSTVSSRPCTAKEAVKAVIGFVREVRLCACPNDGFMQQLAEYTSRLLSASVNFP
ncbi:hypothetical protein C3747_128g18 [Trypanosoma cruzi]|uniref:Tyrosine specific protein phosphatases domain-containing protein n=2 Tax=Trypanosoma cruzi TaxID=5693 RepID=Q4DL55_TRYCC|nr:hypothetical protein, conserved [Trypanosoma cruzi]EAN93257.1 hypothetical protein, conserved [Trypanosoma cruzi]PWV05558.1 hypothetical protein C3747_128g18 [Trypanosoma cruzi]RNC39401.1 phosphoric monoester hydrolase [Trypanosoma cruzi]|eukprot:XP_815108.1 hypothetical protein [Trypanosoma cruzi strain CL Brener]